MMWFFAALIVLVLGGIAVVAAGGGASMKASDDDHTPSGIPDDGPLVSDHLRSVRFPLAFRGYRMAEVDALLDRMASQIAVAEVSVDPDTDGAPIEVTEPPELAGESADEPVDDQVADEPSDPAAAGPAETDAVDESSSDDVSVPADDDERRA